jgi:hypothetical protein
MVFRILRWLIALFVAIQLVPFGREHSNPPVIREPPWDSPQTRALARRACYNCHSHETAWPWYSLIAPASWLATNHVTEGRKHLNFSEWNKPQRHANDIEEQIHMGEMPPSSYLLFHPEAKLTAAEQEALIDGFAKMLGYEAKATQ